MKTIKAGIIGYGQRARGVISPLLKVSSSAQIVAVCDAYADRAEKAMEYDKEKTGKTCLFTTDANEIINNPEINLVFVFASWEAHIPLCIQAMKAGKAVAVEVAGAYSIKQCWDIVKTYEQTKMPIMMLENCCYGKRETMIKRMKDAGFFGDIIHVDGAYSHDLRGEISDGIKIRHYRLRNYLNRNCDNYPTHELGPIAKLLDIGNGNRFVSLSSFASKSCGLEQFIKTEREADTNIQNLRFNQGDVITTVITCSGGQTITLTLNTTLPTFGTRNYNVYGTKAVAHANTRSICEGSNKDHLKKAEMGDWSTEWDNEKSYEQEWLHPMWKEYLASGIKSGHGGMDYLMLKDFVDCFENEKPMPVDVYDMATWMAVSALSEKSISLGGAPVEFPDFTNGNWLL